ncbi:MAG TPA: hypothetical protein PLJ27_11845 [Polyangiaceae bacterium]|jgi:hypothetical protein|nr:hypothetical protein [Polyangiaceae bacterium]HNZ23490.1 hypothetical protein [Polyangiaceae bacterium]HOD23023.1 hypothetical protein [Polyangiaceae bacterium]HOE49590.1 hypothetical protein [Polyangiaceae bacterium]HOH01261.1 hypothetical protein [Polyangiaceae bacterium]
MIAVYRLRWLPAVPYAMAGYAIRLALAFVLIHPIASVVERTLAGWPANEHMMFHSGSLLFSEVLRLHGVAFHGLLEQLALGALLMIPIGIVIHAFVIASFVDPDTRDLKAIASLAIARMLPVAVVSLLSLLAISGMMILSWVIREGVRSMLPFDTRTNDMLSLGSILVGALAVVVSLVMTDLARIATIRDKLGVAEAIALALHSVRKRPFEIFGAFGARVSASIFLAMVGLTFPLMFGIETSIPASCWIIVQQVIVVVMSCLRLSWLARAASFQPRLSQQGSIDLEIPMR